MTREAEQIARLTARVIALEAVVGALIAHVFAPEETGELFDFCERAKTLIAPHLLDLTDLPWLPATLGEQTDIRTKCDQILALAHDLRLG